MGALVEDHLVGEDGQLPPERIKGTVAPMWFAPHGQGCLVWNCSEPLPGFCNAREVQSGLLHLLHPRWRACTRCTKSPAYLWGSKYEEYIPDMEEVMKKDALYETYREVLCHFHIWAQTTRLKVRGLKQMSWANYLFQGLGDKIGLVS